MIASNIVSKELLGSAKKLEKLLELQRKLEFFVSNWQKIGALVNVFPDRWSAQLF